MVNWNNPTETDSYLDILDWVRERDEKTAKLDYTGDSNVPQNFVRYDSSANKFQRTDGANNWSNLGFHTAIDSHIADTALHEAFKTGDVKMAAYATPTSGWLLCNGQAVSRSTYSTLFNTIGTTFGTGDGSTTFNVPDYQMRLPIGAGASVALGATAGSWDHTHTVASHTHTLNSHTHTMKNHVHSVGAHTHTIPDHAHLIPGHGHASTHPYSTILVNDSGAHTHGVYAKEGGSNGSQANRAQGASSTSGSNVTYTSASDSHSHAHSAFAGTVGAWDGGGVGVSGDGNFACYGAGVITSNGSAAFNSGAPNDNTTDGSGTLTTNSGGAGASGSANPPVLGIHFFIKI